MQHGGRRRYYSSFLVHSEPIVEKPTLLVRPASRGIPVVGCDISQIESRECACGHFLLYLVAFDPSLFRGWVHL
jgi:hypothetical protein